MNYIRKLKEFANEEIDLIRTIEEHGCKEVHEFSLKCSDLEMKYVEQDIRYSDNFKDMFEKLAAIKGPVVYIFKIISKTSSDEIIQNITEYKNRKDGRTMPPVNQKDSDILYVGKVTKNFWGRVIHHMGYYRIPGTQGLQLYYWAPLLNLELQIIALEFEIGTEVLMPVFERKFSDFLRPILGQHK